MYKQVFVSFALICLIFVIKVNAETKEFCDTTCAATSCVAVGDCNLPNQVVVRSKDPCQCCAYCLTILSEGVRCDNPPIVNGFPATQECDKKKRLICKDGRCQKRVL